MTRAVLAGFVLTSACAACAQVPDVFLRVDLYLHMRSSPMSDTTLRAYDSLGHISTVGLVLTLEPGFQAFIAQRLKKIPNDADDQQLDELYVEDPGYWRAGKQYLPFGRNQLLRESVEAVRLDTRFSGAQIPLTASGCDSGIGLQQGVMGRLGSKIGLNFAGGRHFGISATSLTVVRLPERSPGRGRGYRAVLGLDYAFASGPWMVQCEVAAFRSGETDLEKSKEVSDLMLSLEPSIYRSLTLGWSRDWSEKNDMFRIQGKFLLTPGIWVEPIYRLRGGKTFDYGASIRVKM